MVGELTIFPLTSPRRYQIPTQCKMLIFHWKGLKGFGPESAQRLSSGDEA